jgi:multidrug efflux pump subunit AcrA (membrane-fusion protein)
MKRRRALALGLGSLVTLGLVASAVTAARRASASARRGVPTTQIRRGRLDLRAYASGELRSSRSAMLVAPSVAGTLQIVSLAQTGRRIREQEVVCEFDTSEQEYNLEQSQSQLLEAEQEITKIGADTAVQAAQDKVAILTARFDVRRAELEVSRNELVSAIDARKNLLSLEEAKRKLEQLEQDVRSRQASSHAARAVAEEKRNKARLDVKQAQQNIEQMKLRAPIAGLVAVKENWDSTGGFFTTGMVLPDYREGDLVQSGRVVAEVLATEDMEILAKVNENDRADLNPGQPVEVQVDAVPGRRFRGKIKTVAGLAARRFWGGDGVKKFDVTFSIDSPDGTIRPGATAQVTIAGREGRDALYVPRQALFEKEGKPVVYVRKGAAFEPREVKLVQRTESHVLIEGLAEGTEVALVNPEQGPGSSARPTAPPGPALGTSTGR